MNKKECIFPELFSSDELCSYYLETNDIDIDDFLLEHSKPQKLLKKFIMNFLKKEYGEIPCVFVFGDDVNFFIEEMEENVGITFPLNEVEIDMTHLSGYRGDDLTLFIPTKNIHIAKYIYKHVCEFSNHSVLWNGFEDTATA